MRNMLTEILRSVYMYGRKKKIILMLHSFATQPKQKSYCNFRNMLLFKWHPMPSSHFKNHPHIQKIQEHSFVIQNKKKKQDDVGKSIYNYGAQGLADT